jgi:hypothetical protein
VLNLKPSLGRKKRMDSNMACFFFKIVMTCFLFKIDFWVPGFLVFRPLSFFD